MESRQNNKWQGENRRQKPRNKDWLYRFTIGLAIVGWIALVVALILFGEARPELATGVQRFWGIEVRSEWSQEYAYYLLQTLRFCLFTSLLAMLLSLRRNRRKKDHFGINLLVLLVISMVSLVTLSFVAELA